MQWPVLQRNLCIGHVKLEHDVSSDPSLQCFTLSHTLLFGIHCLLDVH